MSEVEKSLEPLQPTPQDGFSSDEERAALAEWLGSGAAAKAFEEWRFWQRFQQEAREHLRETTESDTPPPWLAEEVSWQQRLLWRAASMAPAMLMVNAAGIASSLVAIIPAQAPITTIAPVLGLLNGLAAAVYGMFVAATYIPHLPGREAFGRNMEKRGYEVLEDTKEIFSHVRELVAERLLHTQHRGNGGRE